MKLGFGTKVDISGEVTSLLFLFLELRIKEVHDLFYDLLLGCFAFGETVIPAFGDVQCRGDARFFQRRVEQLALVERNDEILVAVDDKAWRVSFTDVGYRVSLFALFRDCLDRRPDEARRGRKSPGTVSSAHRSAPAR